jgi:cytochrome c biogenesis protein CcdA
MQSTVKKIFAFLFLTAGILLNTSVPISRAADTPLPTMLFFYSETCEHCLRVSEDFLPGFLGKYGSRIDFVRLEVSSPGVLDSLYALESRVRVPETGKEYPAIYFMGSMLEGETLIRLQLESMLERYISNPDSAKAFEREVMSRAPEKFDTSALQGAKTVHVAYFFKQGCPECSRADEIIDWLEGLYGSIEITRFDIAEERSKVLSMALGERAGVPEKRRLSTPMFFIGSDYLLSEQISRGALADMIGQYAQFGAPASWEQFTEDELARARSSITTAFKSFSVFAVALAGLGDGINPCAFATILFLVSYLGMVGRKRNEILLVGISFACAVFTTYFLVGLGFFRFIESLSNITKLADIIFGGTAVLCFIFGLLSISDYLKARAGNTGDMALQLPKFLKLRIHQTIRERARTERLVAGAIAAGFVISLLELACTGQIYLPTIIFMVGSEGYTSRALLYLLLYNICFIIPLLIVFTIVYLGVSSKTIGNVMETKVGSVKLVLAVVFFTVGGLLAWTALH